MTNILLIKEDLRPGVEDVIFNRKRMKDLLFLLFSFCIDCMWESCPFSWLILLLQNLNSSLLLSPH